MHITRTLYVDRLERSRFDEPGEVSSIHVSTAGIADEGCWFDIDLQPAEAADLRIGDALTVTIATKEDA